MRVLNHAPMGSICFTISDFLRNPVLIDFDDRSHQGNPVTTLELNDYSVLSIEYRTNREQPYYWAIHQDLGHTTLKTFFGQDKASFAKTLESYLIQYEATLPRQLLPGEISLSFQAGNAFLGETLRSAFVTLYPEDRKNVNSLFATVRWSPETLYETRKNGITTIHASMLSINRINGMALYLGDLMPFNLATVGSFDTLRDWNPAVDGTEPMDFTGGILTVGDRTIPLEKDCAFRPFWWQKGNS